MKILLSRRTLFLLGFIVLVATNSVVLSGVASNRSGEPFSQITLTERELQLPHDIHEENSGLALKLAWRTLDKDGDYSAYYQYSFWNSPAWLNTEKLEELGFDINTFPSSDDKASDYRQPLPREVFIVLEKDGATYRESLVRAEAELEKEKSALASKPDNEGSQDDYESAEKQLKQERLAETRLFAIDAGLNFDALKGTYGDQSRFIIIKGAVSVRYENDEDTKEVSGYISDLSVESIHVPLKQRQIFDSVLAQTELSEDDITPPRYEVELAFGSRLEPWIVSVKTMGE